MSSNRAAASLRMRENSQSRGRGRLLISSAVIQGLVIVLLTAAPALAKDALLRARYAGAVTTTNIDLNADEEETARVSTGVGSGTVIGPFVFHELRESDLLEFGHPDFSCAPDEIELVEVHWTIVLTDQLGQSQLFFRLAADQPSMICIDPSSPPTGGDVRTHDFDIIGGTNRFEGAGGRVTVQCGGRALAPGVPAGGPAHGAVSCTMNGSLHF